MIAGRRVQALVYFFYKGVWVLPVAGFLVGYGTNWVALKLIFEPAHPRSLGCFTLQVRRAIPCCPRSVPGAANVISAQLKKNSQLIQTVLKECSGL